jgi:hypothetical protein
VSRRPGIVLFARDEGFYFRAANQYRAWFERLFSDPDAAMRADVIDRYWKTNREHPAFVKSLFALSDQLLYRKRHLFAEEGTAYRFPGMVLSAMAVGTTYLWGRHAFSRLCGLVAAVLLAMMPRVFYHSHLDCFDMPVLGNLFKAETRSRNKSNLMVFLRPVVVRDSVQTDELSLDRYELMRSKQIEAQPVPSGAVRVNESPVLPPITRPRTLPGTTTAPSPAAPVPPQTAPSSR